MTKDELIDVFNAETKTLVRASNFMRKLQDAGIGGFLANAGELQNAPECETSCYVGSTNEKYWSGAFLSTLAARSGDISDQRCDAIKKVFQACAVNAPVKGLRTVREASKVNVEDQSLGGSGAYPEVKEFSIRELYKV